MCCGCVSSFGGNKFPTDRDLEKNKFEQKNTTALNGRMNTDHHGNIKLTLARKVKSGAGWELKFSLHGFDYPLGVPSGQKVIITI
jgi:hypothetical protein